MKPLPGWGINLTAHDMTASNIDWLIQSMKELRCEWVRYEFDMRQLIDDVLEEKWIEACQQANIKVLGLLNYSIPGSIQNVLFPEFFHSDVKQTRLLMKEFVTKIVSKYKESITHWEILNEPNTKRFWISKPNHQEYLQLLRQISQTIKAIQPQGHIVFAGVVGDDNSIPIPFAEKKFFQKSLQAGAEECFSISNFHPYCLDCYISLKSYRQQRDAIIKTLENTYRYAQTHSSKQVWFTELGIATKWVRLKQQEIAKLYFESYKWCTERNIPLFLWTLHDLKNPRVNRLSPETHFGLLDHHLEPKQTFKSLASLIKTAD